MGNEHQTTMGQQQQPYRNWRWSYRAPLILSTLLACGNAACSVVRPHPIPRVSINDLTPEVWAKYDGIKPLMITGMMRGWPAAKWTPKYLKKLVGDRDINWTWQKPYALGSG